VPWILLSGITAFFSIIFFVFNFNTGDDVYYQTKFQWLACQDDLFSVFRVNSQVMSAEDLGLSKKACLAPDHFRPYTSDLSSQISALNPYQRYTTLSA